MHFQVTPITPQRAPNPNTIKIPHGILACMAIRARLKHKTSRSNCHQASRPRGHKHQFLFFAIPTQIFKSLRHRTERQNNQTQSVLRIAFVDYMAFRVHLRNIKRQDTLAINISFNILHCMAIRVRLRNTKRHGWGAINFNLNPLSRSGLQFNAHPANTQSRFRIILWQFLRVRLRNTKRQGRMAIKR